MTESASSACQPASVEGVVITAPVTPAQAALLNASTLAFVADLERTFRARRDRLLLRRDKQQARFDRGARPDFLRKTAAIRAADWQVPPAPPDARDRRVEITGPVERKMIINALNSTADVFMADFEDSCAPTWENVIQGQVNLYDAVRGTISWHEKGRDYVLATKAATLMVRPRGWHLDEAHVLVDGRPVTAALFDFALYLAHNAQALQAKGSGPYFYLPKMESQLEARLWARVFAHAEQRLLLQRGTIRATVLIETLPAAFLMDEMLWELREYALGLNCGRWDYIFSCIKKLGHQPGTVLPDRAQVAMTQHFLRSYSLLLIKTCHRRGAYAMGGMAAQIPVKDDDERNAAALARVTADKAREAADGHDGTWVAHPALVAVARQEFAPVGVNQLHVMRDDVTVTADDLLRFPPGDCTDQGLRTNIRVALLYIESWLRGKGCVPIDHLMEDAATAEISRAQVWQWLRHGVRLADGRMVCVNLVLEVIADELNRIRRHVGPLEYARGAFRAARDVFTNLVIRTDFVPFLTLPAYQQLLALDQPAASDPHTQREEEDTMQVHKLNISINGHRKHKVASEPPKPAIATAHRSPWEERRWEGIVRDYTRRDVEKLRGSIHIDHTLATRGARRLWDQMNHEDFVAALGAVTGNQAMQMVRGGLKAIYVSGWQVAADANVAGQMYPDQSLYPCNSVPLHVKRINQTFQRADQIDHLEGRSGTDWFVPIVADAEAGFGGPLNAFEIMKAMIEAGAAAVHFEDQLASEKKCGHLGGKVLVPTQNFIRVLNAARLAADTMDVPTLLFARTDAEGATLITSDVDERDRPFLTGERTPEGFFRIKNGLATAIARGLAYAPYADVVWCETGEPNLEEAKHFAEAIRAQHPKKLLAYNCSPSFNWKAKLDNHTIAKFQRELGAMGYKFQFVTLAGFHSLNHGMFKLAKAYSERGMTAYAELQSQEFQSVADGYTAVRHQREVGTGYFDAIANAVAGGSSSTTALTGSTEEAQFKTHHAPKA
jgi:malate synthase A